MESDDSETMPSGSLPFLKQYGVAGKLSATIKNIVHGALAQGLEVQNDESIGENSWAGTFEPVYGEQNSLMEFANV